MRVCKGVELITNFGRDCNIYVIDNELLIDTGTGQNFMQHKKQIEDNFDVYNIKRIINTHYHFDHTGGNQKFRDWLKAEILIHENDSKFLEKGETLAEFFGEKPRIVTPDKILKEGDKIKTENFTFTVISTPGHSPGSMCLYEPTEKLMISGDTLFEDNVGRTDLPGGSHLQLQESLKKISNLQIRYLMPGHGSPKFGGIEFLIKSMSSKMTMKSKL